MKLGEQYGWTREEDDEEEGQDIDEESDEWEVTINYSKVLPENIKWLRRFVYLDDCLRALIVDGEQVLLLALSQEVRFDSSPGVKDLVL